MLRWKEWLILDVDDHGREMSFREERIVMQVFPQELRTLIELQGRFEQISFFERYSTRRLKKASNDNLVVLRRR